ncbi:hypothetical protein PLESTB_001668800 [Pleodorina starrii]|uniref:CUE domain-containing protein n=1 Tax=Pleodorina starrii TaxID=330485 RepID=A0A9W6BYZ9_9CHLO|nr:hypothetical protein PLESTM_000625900 [Pleodorina starrii]GLC60769.1 hypothetical protein PLESTB_001668800 [Pleodorina starrii]GLC75488.1 hypothetical protein PLESTF_001643200 [Pleodorina starrii]
MSVISIASPVLAKRHFDEGEAGDSFDRQLGGKRSRQHYSPASARCVQFAAGGLHAVPPTTLSALLALFPGMDERTVSNVLSECGSNIDAAIRRLGELRLSATADTTVEAAAQAAASSSVPPAASPAGLHRTAADPAALPGTPALLGAAAGGSGGGTAAAAADPAALPRGTAGAGASGGPMTAEQWVDLLVAEMSAASDMGDARQRAVGFLGQFEAFVARFVKQQQQAGEAGAADAAAAGGSGGASAAGLAARAAKLAEENAVLKKAVQIQHRQLQERAAQEAEVGQLKALLAQYQEQVRTLQVSNYSLTLHLQKATNSGVLGEPRNPDVF